MEYKYNKYKYKYLSNLLGGSTNRSVSSLGYTHSSLSIK